MDLGPCPQENSEKFHSCMILNLEAAMMKSYGAVKVMVGGYSHPIHPLYQSLLHNHLAHMMPILRLTYIPRA